MTAAKLREIFPNATERFIADNADDLRPARPAPRPVVERPARPRPLETPQAQTGDTKKFFVRVTSFRRRLIDPDNLSEKYFVDCCRFACLIPDDSADQIRIETTQQKVRTKAQEHTLIEITKNTENT